MNANDIHAIFKSYNRTLCSIESFTGGRFASSITSLSGASKFFMGAMVTYATIEKEKLLSIDHARIEQFGVVSQEICGDMAMHGKYIMGSDYAIAFTGNAGPDAMENKPVGEIYIGITAYSTTQVFKYQLNGTREEIINQALELGYQHLNMMIQSFK